MPTPNNRNGQRDTKRKISEIFTDEGDDQGFNNVANPGTFIEPNIYTRTQISGEASLESPNIDIFHKEILKIPGYSIERLNDSDNNSSFVVYKEVDGKKIEVLKGDKDSCQMSSPIDQSVLKAFLKAHNAKELIVDVCTTKEAAQQLLDACNNHVPRVSIKFPAGKLEELGFDNWTSLKHSLPPKEVAQKEAGPHNKNPGMSNH